MPTPNPEPRFGVTPWFDPRPWRSTVVATFGGANVTIPAAAEPSQDVRTFLNGRGVARPLGVSLTANRTGAGVWSIGIDSADRFYVECNGDDFTVSDCAALGFSAAGLVGGGGPVYRRTAQADWVRGQCSNLIMAITPTLSAAFGLVVSTKRTVVESPTTYLVADGSDPYDGTLGSPATQNFSALAAAAATRDEFHASLDAEGHVTMAWALAPLLAWVWVDPTFMRALGYDGTETAVATSGTMSVLRANHALPGVWAPQHPPVTMAEGGGEETTRTRMRSGRVRAAVRGRWNTMSVEAWMYGRAAGVDELAHLTRRCRAIWHEGALVTLYREWGDPRWAQDLLESAGLYDAYRTPEHDGRHGRRRYYVARPLDVLQFDQEGLEYRALLRLELEEAP
jgi:hypothetical protein